MKKSLIGILSAIIVLTMLLSACYHDGPPKDDTPEPAALDGTFAYEGSSLIFNGDGRSVKVDAAPELAALTDLPEGESDGTYVFIYQNGSYRRDKSEYFRMMIGDKTYQFRNDLGVTDEDTVAFYSLDNKSEIIFEKQK